MIRKTSKFNIPSRTDRIDASRQTRKFVGKNLLPEEYQRLSLDELQWRLKQTNHDWLQKQFSKLNAAWVVVIDGKVTAFGKTPENRPLSSQIVEICRRTGKFPFIFANDKFIVIEEGAFRYEIKMSFSQPALSMLN